MSGRDPCVYMLANGLNGTLYVGVTSDLPTRLIERQNPMWNDLAALFGLEPLAVKLAVGVDPGTGPG